MADEARDSVHRYRLGELTFSQAAALCRSFEERAGMSSPEFFDRYLQGEFIGSHDAMRWAGYWRAFLRLRPPAEAPVPKDLSELVA